MKADNNKSVTAHNNKIAENELKIVLVKIWKNRNGYAFLLEDMNELKQLILSDKLKEFEFISSGLIKDFVRIAEHYLHGNNGVHPDGYAPNLYPSQQTFWLHAITEANYQLHSRILYATTEDSVLEYVGKMGE